MQKSSIRNVGAGLKTGIGEGGRHIALMAALLVAGFALTSSFSFLVSRQALRASIVENELPVTSDTVYSEIQRDLIRPIFISSMMASDTFLRDWILAGERTPENMVKYLGVVASKYEAFTAFMVSERSRIYYQAEGILKQVSEKDERDAWYFRVKTMKAPYEINVDPDLAHADALTVFINFRVLDYRGNFIGAAGVGLNVAAIASMTSEYRQKYGRSVYFVDREGKIVAGSPGDMEARSSKTPSAGTGKDSAKPVNIRDIAGLSDIADSVLAVDRGSFQYERGGKKWLLNVRVVDELGWHLFVEKDENAATAGIRGALLLSLAIWTAITLLILALATMTIRRYQRRLERTASVDGLTGLLTRPALAVLADQAFKEQRREGRSLCLVMVDLDHFKNVNDRYGHQTGDSVLLRTVKALRACLRESDLAARWGGEEFLIILPSCGLAEAATIAEKMRVAVAAGDGEGVAAITASFGLAERGEGESLDELVRRADAALYHAKAEGRDRLNLA